MIIVSTPTGQIGSAVVARLRDSGADFRVIARDPSRLPAGVSAITGSHGDPTVIDAALRDADALFWLVPPNFGVDSSIAYYRAFTAPAYEAIVRHDVSRVVVVSTLGDGPNAGAMTAALEMEQQLRATGAAVRSLRLPFFMENLLRQRESLAAHGAFYLPSREDRVLPLVATDDAGTVAAELLLDDTWTGQSGIPVIGTGDLTPEGMAEVMTTVLGRPITFTQISLQAYGRQLREHGASDGAARDAVAMAAATNDGFYDRDPYLAQTRGGEPFPAWCKRVLVPALQCARTRPGDAQTATGRHPGHDHPLPDDRTAPRDRDRPAERPHRK